ncbi:MAG: hypothetical protein K2M11_07470 [Paramuribaculum sp.]|nr:hypothetical protein [Paramuribaculum sp.]
MKRILLFLSVMVAGIAAMNAQSNCCDSKCSTLKNAYDQIALAASEYDINVNNMQVPLSSKNMVLKNLQVKIAFAKDSVQADSITTAVYNVINSSVPMQYMINGGNNQLSTCLIYAREISDGQYEILDVERVENGKLTVVAYATTDYKTVKSIQNYPVAISGESLSVLIKKTPTKTEWFSNWGNPIEVSD